MRHRHKNLPARNYDSTLKIRHAPLRTARIIKISPPVFMRVIKMWRALFMSWSPIHLLTAVTVAWHLDHISSAHPIHSATSACIGESYNFDVTKQPLTAIPDHVIAIMLHSETMTQLLCCTLGFGFVFSPQYLTWGHECLSQNLIRFINSGHWPSPHTTL